MSNEYYTVLEIPTNATTEQVRNGYFSMVRKCPPERHPGKFKAIQEAYNILRDEQARRDYDILQKHGGEIERLLQEARQAGENQEHQRAVQLLKRVLVIHPENTGAMAMLAEALDEAKEPIEAVRAYERLIQHSQTSAEYHVRAGFACLAAHKASKETTYLTKLRTLCNRAIELEPINSMAYLAIALSYYAVDDNANALKHVDKAIVADDKVDYQDVPAFELKMRICIEDANRTAFGSLAAQVKANINDSQLRNHVVVRLYKVCEPYYVHFFNDEDGGLGIKHEYIRFMRDAMQFFCEIGSGEIWLISNDIRRRLDIALEKHRLVENLIEQQKQRSMASSSGGGSGCMVIIAVATPIITAAACVVLLLAYFM